MPPRRPNKGGRAQQMRTQKNSDTVNSNIRVVVRIRPQNAREREAENSRVVVCPVDEKILTFDPKVEESPSYFRGRRMRRRNVMQRKSRDIQFVFDHVFHEGCSQEYVYEHTTKSIVDSILSGYNCSVFAYGATGAGKTFTMLGGPDQPGVMFLTVMELYHKIASQQADKLCDVAVSYLEIYNETVKDLLVPTGPLAIREDPQRGVVVSGLSLHKPKSAKELFSMLEYGNTNRTQHPTDANAQSSRSHAVFQVFVRQRDRTADISTNVRVAKMSLIDLAGSERATVTTNRGARFREGANINRSLLALGNCINALADNKNKGKHIPYRNSKLTRLLKDSLGGNCKTVMIAAVSPSSLSYEDTYNTLRYADRAKEIKSTLQKNVVNIDMHISRYTQIIAELRAEVTELKGKLQKQVAVPMATMQQPTAQAPEPEFVVNLRLELNKVFQQRSSIRKELLELESFDRDLTAKISRKNILVERLRLIHGDTTLGEKTTSKMERVVAASTARQNRVRSRKVGVEQRMRENQETLNRLVENAQKASPEGALPEVIQDTLRMRHLEIEIKDGRRQAKHLRKFARHQENHIKSSEKLILRLLSVVRSQYFLIKGSGIATSDLTNEFEGIQKQVANEREVMWADQSQTEGSLALEEAEAEDFNRLLNLPILSCVQITPSGQRRVAKTPSPQQQQKQNNGTTPYQSIPSRRLSYATACQTMVGITPTATGGALRIPGFENQPSCGQPQRIPTPNMKQNHTPQRVATPQRIATPQRVPTSPAVPAQSVPKLSRDYSSVEQRLVSQDVTTLPGNRPSVMPLQRTEGIPNPDAAVEQSTLSTDPSGRVLPSSVESGVDSPASPQLASDSQQEFQVDGIAPLQATPLNETTSSQVEQSDNALAASPSSLAGTVQVPGVSAGGVEESTSKPAISEGQSKVTETTPVAREISFDDENSRPSSKPAVSPVTACKLTYAQVASSPVVSQPTRVPFANISVNSPVIRSAPSPVKKAPALNQSFTICKGVPEENFRQDNQQRKHSRRDTFSARSRPSLYHQRSRSQGHLNVESRPATSNVKTQHADTLRKYGLPSMADNSSGGPSKPVPAYMSMTKAAAGKRRGNYGEARPLSQTTKENVPPANRGRPLFSTGPFSMKGNVNNSNNNRGSSLARSFSVGNIRQASRNMSNSKSHSAWNF